MLSSGERVRFRKRGGLGKSPYPFLFLDYTDYHSVTIFAYLGGVLIPLSFKEVGILGFNFHRNLNGLEVGELMPLLSQSDVVSSRMDRWMLGP